VNCQFGRLYSTKALYSDLYVKGTSYEIPWKRLLAFYHYEDQILLSGALDY
jgi:hypothetical protein